MPFKQGDKVVVIKPTVGMVGDTTIPLWNREGTVLKYKPFPPPPVADIEVDGNKFTVFTKTLKGLE